MLPVVWPGSPRRTEATHDFRDGDDVEDTQRFYCWMGRCPRAVCTEEGDLHDLMLAGVCSHVTCWHVFSDCRWLV